LRLCRGNNREQGRLAGVGKANHAYIGQQLEFQDYPFFDGGFPGLGMLRGLLCGRGEVCVSPSSATTCRKYKGVAMVLHLTNHLARFGTSRHSSQWDFQNLVFAGGACAVLCLTRLPILRNYMLPVFKVQQGPKLFVAPKDHTSSTATVTTVRPAFRIEFLPVKMEESRPAFSGARMEFYIVDEIG